MVIHYQPKPTLFLRPKNRRGRAYEWSNMGAFLPQKFYLFVAGALLFTYWPKLGSWPVPRVLGPLVWLGEISYPIYLVHYPLVALINAYLPVGTEPITRAIILLAISLPPVILASWLLHRTVEKPFIELGKRLTHKQSKPGSETVTTTCLREGLDAYVEVSQVSGR